jgi:hypothetical protein
VQVAGQEGRRPAGGVSEGPGGGSKSGAKRSPSEPAPDVAYTDSHTHLIVYSTFICSFRAFSIREGGQAGGGRAKVCR